MNQDGPSMIIETPPPPPPPGPPYSHRYKYVFTYMSNLLSIVFLVVHMYPVWWGLHDTHFSTSGFNIRIPRTPQNLKKMSSDYFHILHIVELWCDFKKFVGPWSIYIYIYIKCLWVLLTNVYWFRATGGYICGCGRPSNLVIIWRVYVNQDGPSLIIESPPPPPFSQRC